jgi:RNA polymerase sigma factor (sigma-70 family)
MSFREQCPGQDAHPSDMDDSTFIELWNAGDPNGAAQLFQRYWRAARAAAYGVTADWASAEDAASEGFFDALRTIRSLQNPDRFGAWLRTIVVRKAQAAAGTRFTELPDNIASECEPPEDTLTRHQLAAAIQKAAQRLPGHLRESIALVYFEGYNSDEAARFLGIPPGTLRRRLHEGCEQLRESVWRQGSTDLEHKAIEELVARGDWLEATRELLALRPPSRDLVQRLFGGPGAAETFRHIQRILRHPPVEHPAIAAIHKALQRFPDWAVRASRGLLSADGLSVYEHLQLRKDMRDLQLVDVWELTWAPDAPVELRAVQEFLESLAAEIRPAQAAEFESYAEPRYRSALQLRFHARRAAVGGVLHDANTAQVRIFLDQWA